MTTPRGVRVVTGKLSPVTCRARYTSPWDEFCAEVEVNGKSMSAIAGKNKERRTNCFIVPTSLKDETRER